MRFHGKRWNYFKNNLIEEFGEKVYKIGIDAGFDCPNRDGEKAYGGCAYCSQTGSLSPHQDPKLGIVEQIKKGQAFNLRRYKAKKYIAYYQAFTNTYGSLETMKERYDCAFVDDSIVGMSIATRPDCVNAEVVDFLHDYKERSQFFAVELGLQSAFQNRLEWVNRQESVQDYVDAMHLLNAANIPVITHVILGFPGESSDEMEKTVHVAQECNTHGLKLQMLHVIKRTKLAVMYGRDPFKLMDMDEYKELIIHLVERINPKIELHRITGETDARELVAPEWTNDKTKFFNLFENELEKRDTWQGKLYQKTNYLSDPEFDLEMPV